MVAYNLDEKSSLLGIFSIKSPSKLVSVSDTVEFKHYTMLDFTKASVQNVTEKTIVVSTTNTVRDNNIFPGDAVVVNYRADELYSMSGTVASISSLEPLEMEININNIQKMKDLRKNERFYVSLIVNLKHRSSVEDIFAIGKNISLCGIKVNCKNEFSIDDTVEVAIQLDKNLKCTYKGKIVRKNAINDYFEYGIEIVESSELNSKALHQFIHKLEFDT